MVPVECEISRAVNPGYVEKAEWPTKLAVRPLKGDCVESKCGNSILQVLSVTHAIVKVPTEDPSSLKYKKVMGLKVYLGR